MIDERPGQVTRATTYARLSLDRSGEGESVDRQLEACRRFAESQGWQVVAEHEDRDVSGFKQVSTPGLEAALDDIRSGRATVFVVWKFDRLTRRGLARAAEILGELERSGARLVSVNDSVDTSTSAGRIVFGALAEIARAESESISVRTRAAHASAAKKGRMHGGGPRCFGYNRDGTIRPEEAAVLRELYQRVIGNESLRSLANDLNARGIRTTLADRPKKGGKELYGGQWRSPVLGKLLRSPRLRGYRIHNGELHKGDWEPIFTEEEHLALLKVLDDPTRLKAKKGRHYLLSGKVRCGRCGGRLKYMPYHSANKIFPRYSCVRQPGHNNCGKLAASMESVDATVVSRIGEYLLATRLADFPLPSDELPALRRLLEEDQQYLNELTKDRYLNRTVDAEAFEVARKELEARIDRTKAAIKQAETSEAVDDELASMRRIVREAGGEPEFGERYMKLLLSMLDPQQGRKVIDRLIEYVEIMPAKRRGGNVFDPSRVVIHWKRPLPEKVLETIGSSWQIAEDAAMAGENPWDALNISFAEADEEWFEKWLDDDAPRRVLGSTSEG